MRSSIKADAIVLKKRSLLNQDSIITFLTADYGRLRVYARGIKKITSRRLPHTQTGNYVKILITKKDQSYYLMQSEIVSAFQKIKLDEYKRNCLYCMFFIIDRLVPENQADREVFLVVKQFLIALSEKTSFTRRDMTEHLNRALGVLGYVSDSLTFESLRLAVEEIMQEKLPHFSI